jgi:hypothetical protein
VEFGIHPLKTMIPSDVKGMRRYVAERRRDDELAGVAVVGRRAALAPQDADQNE